MLYCGSDPPFGYCRKPSWLTQFRLKNLTNLEPRHRVAGRGCDADPNEGVRRSEGFVRAAARGAKTAFQTPSIIDAAGLGGDPP
jgi:hypothetical protein